MSSARPTLLPSASRTVRRIVTIALSCGLLLLVGSVHAQEPWLEFGSYPWGVRLHEELVHVGGVEYSNQVQIWYPATVEGEDVPAADGGPYPVIVFEHAGGSDYTWYDHQFSRLASRGFIVLSIRHDHVACALPWWACHAELYHVNLELAFEGWNLSPSHFLFDRMDVTRIGLGGHSHGAAFLAAQQLAPMNPSADYEVRSVFLIAPCPDVAITSYADAYEGMPPLQVIYGSKDECGCTGNGQGIAIYDPASRPRHHAYVIGANHWAFCEGGSISASTISRLEAWRASSASLAALHSLIYWTDQTALPYLRGELPLTEGSPEVRYQFEESDRLLIDDFGDGAMVFEDGVAIAGIPGQTFINGFLGDTFVDFSAGVALVQEEIRALVTGAAPEVLFYRDGTAGSDAYEEALDLEVASGLLPGFTFTASPSEFGTLIATGSWDLIISANQTGSSSATHPFDVPLADYICSGGKAIVSDFRVLSATADSVLQCSDSGFDATTNWSTMTSTDPLLFSGTLAMQNPGWGIWTNGVLADDAAVVYATNETSVLTVVSDPTLNALGLVVSQSGWVTFDEEYVLAPSRTLYHPTHGLELAWDAPGATFTTVLSDSGGLDSTPWQSLSFRLLQEYGDPLNPTGASKDLHVRLEDVDGDSAEVTLSDAPQGSLRAASAPDPAVGWKSIFESYRFRLEQFSDANPALDLDRLASLTLVCDITPTGRCFLDDIALDGARTLYVRGDCNVDGAVDLGDAVFTLNALFDGGEASTCTDACDVNADFALDIADPVSLLSFLFISGPAPAAPYPACAEAPGSGLDCDSFAACP